MSGEQKHDGVPEPNYTQVPNVILDTMRHYGDAEFRVIMAICRKTFGYHKTSDTISLTQFQELTGLSRQGVVNALDGKIASRIIDRVKKGQSFEYRLKVVNEIDYWSTRLTSSSQRSRPQVVNEVDTQKKRKKGKKGEEEEDARARERDDSDLSFLSDEDADLYGETIRQTLADYPDAGGSEFVVRRVFPRNKQAQRYDTLRGLVREHGWVRVVSALVITADLADSPSIKYAASVLKGFNEPKRLKDGYSYDNPNGRRGKRRGGEEIGPAANHDRLRRLASDALGIEP